MNPSHPACVCRQYGLKGLKGLGGFRNVRQEFDWEGLVLELDQTRFDHGTVYELEAETVSTRHWGLIARLASCRCTLRRA